MSDVKEPTTLEEKLRDMINRAYRNGTRGLVNIDACYEAIAEIERLRTELAAYSREFDGEGKESAESILARERRANAAVVGRLRAERDEAREAAQWFWHEGDPWCEHVHHQPSQYHKGVVCPVVTEIKKRWPWLKEVT